MYFDRKKDFFGFKTYCYSFKGYFKEAFCHRFTKKSIIKNHSNSAKKINCYLPPHSVVKDPCLSLFLTEEKGTENKYLLNF